MGQTEVYTDLYQCTQLYYTVMVCVLDMVCCGISVTFCDSVTVFLYPVNGAVK